MKKILKNYWYIIIVIFLFLFLILFNDNTKNDEIIGTNIIEEETIEHEEENKKIYYVDIKGEVKTPGVYSVSEGSRIIDVINISGGLTKNADTSLINLSKKVTDEMNIIIYSKNDIKEAKERLNPTIVEVIKEVEKDCICPKNNECDNTNDAIIDINENKLININTASKEMLMTLPKIGESKADSIIEYRENNKFNTIDDIKNVSGIGDSLFESIKEYIIV